MQENVELKEVPLGKLYILKVNGEFIRHPQNHADESLRGRVVNFSGPILRRILNGMMMDISANEVGDSFQVYRVR